jgi:hypothetical protein
LVHGEMNEMKRLMHGLQQKYEDNTVRSHFNNARQGPCVWWYCVDATSNARPFIIGSGVAIELHDRHPHASKLLNSTIPLPWRENGQGECAAVGSALAILLHRIAIPVTTPISTLVCDHARCRECAGRWQDCRRSSTGGYGRVRSACQARLHSSYHGL